VEALRTIAAVRFDPLFGAGQGAGLFPGRGGRHHLAHGTHQTVGPQYRWLNQGRDSS